jgi:hypothetical protein
VVSLLALLRSRNFSAGTGLFLQVRKEERMKLLSIALAIAAFVWLAGCEIRERTAVDPHRDWWSQRHQEEVYDRDRAAREHRDWCARTPDRSCEGWR